MVVGRVADPDADEPDPDPTRLNNMAPDSNLNISIRRENVGKII